MRRTAFSDYSRRVRVYLGVHDEEIATVGQIAAACVLRGVPGRALDAFFSALDADTLAGLIAPRPRLAKMLVTAQ